VKTVGVTYHHSLIERNTHNSNSVPHPSFWALLVICSYRYFHHPRFICAKSKHITLHVVTPTHSSVELKRENSLRRDHVVYRGKETHASSEEKPKELGTNSGDLDFHPISLPSFLSPGRPHLFLSPSIFLSLPARVQIPPRHHSGTSSISLCGFMILVFPSF
jgi:hypothetical protein